MIKSKRPKKQHFFSIVEQVLFKMLRDVRSTEVLALEVVTARSVPGPNFVILALIMIKLDRFLAKINYMSGGCFSSTFVM